MLHNRRMKFVEKNNGPSGSTPEYGAIFMSSSATKKECLRRGVFGLPTSQASFVKQASSDGAMNIVPSAFCSSGKKFPAQVNFVEMWQCMPLQESEFRDAIKENYFSAKKFNFGLSEVQARGLLTLFSFKKLERLLLARTEVPKPTESPPIVFDRGGGNHNSVDDATSDNYGDMDHKLDLIVTCSSDSSTSRRNPVEYNSFSGIPCLDDKPEIVWECDMATKNDYSEDTSEDFRRVSDHGVLGIRDEIGNDFRRVSSFRTDGSTMPFDYSLSNVRRIPKNLRRTSIDRFEHECPARDGFAQVVTTRYPTSWSNLSPSANHGKGPAEANTMAFDPPRLPLEPLYTMYTEKYNPSYPSLHRDATMASTTPYGSDPYEVDPMLSSASATNSNFILGEGLNSCGGYVNGALSSKKVQPFSSFTKHDGASNHRDANLGQGDYVPSPSNLDEHSTRSRMIGVASSENVSRRPFQIDASRCYACHLHLLNSTETGENARNYKRLSYSSPIVLHPASAFPLSSQDGDDLALRDRISNEVPAYQNKNKFGDDASDFNTKWGWFQDHVAHAGCENQKTRSSVFTRLVLPSKECHAERDTYINDPVEEVMAFLHDCQEDWMKQQKHRPNVSHSNGVRKFKYKKQNSHGAELLEDNSASLTETTQNVVLACDESIEETAKKPIFVGFRRRSEIQRARGGQPQTQQCKDNTEDPTPEKKKRKLVRPKLSRAEPSKGEGISDNPAENDTASVISAGENEFVACEVQVMSSAGTESNAPVKMEIPTETTTTE